MTVDLTRFQLDEDLGVYLPPDSGDGDAFGYTDGDAYEEYVRNAIDSSEDVGNDSDELMGKVRDWPSYYHLGIGRSTILRSLDLSSSDSVLELGGGCGALTRYLGENTGSVDMIEGSLVRSRIAASRCRGLDNVRVYCSNLSDVDITRTYDVAALIGVLEYAPIYFSSEMDAEEACVEVLELAGRAVGNNGRLVVAIENKVGLKYWSGCPEDHTGRIYDGIEGYPRQPAPVTFSKLELTRLLERAGFGSSAFFYCFPDYKFATTVFSDTGNANDLCLYNWIKPPFASHDNPRVSTFHEALAAKTLCQAGMLRDFANSFVVVAAKEPVPRTPWTAKRYSVKRQRPLRCVTTLVEGESGVRVEKQLLEDRTTDRFTTPEGVSLLHRAEEAKWHEGEVLTYEIYRRSLAPGFAEGFRELLERYHRELLEGYGTGRQDPEGYPLVKGTAHDFIFRNIIQQNGTWRGFDDEWISENDIPVDFVLYRCIQTTLSNLTAYGLGHYSKDPVRAAARYIRNLYPGYGRSRHERNRKLEDSLQRLVVGNTDPKLLPRGLRALKNEALLSTLRYTWNLLPARARLTIRQLAGRCLSR